MWNTIIGRQSAAAVLMLGLATLGRAAEVGYYQQPALHDDRLVFVSEGDLWTAALPPFASPEAAAPIIAYRLTASDGSESHPVLDPTGKFVAFAADVGGNTDVYAMAIDGGAPVRLTFHPGVDRPFAWSADGNEVIFGSGRAQPNGRMEAWRVSRFGGLPAAMGFGECSALSMSSTGRRIAFTPWSNEHWNWKGYRGGTAPEIWIGDTLANIYIQITDDPANDLHPMLLLGRVYFLSDRGGSFNLYSVNAQGDDLKQHTNFAFDAGNPTAPEGYDARWASVGAGRRASTIVFCQAGGIVRFDASSEAIERLDIQIASDRVAARQRFAKIGETLAEAAIAPDGSALVVGSRGELLHIDVESKRVAQLTHTPAARERGAQWLGEDQIVLISDQPGEPQIVLMPSDGAEPPSLVTDDRKAWLFAPKTSPDGRWIAFADSSFELHVIDMQTVERTPVERADAGEITDYRFSPDSRWLAYTKPAANGMSQVMLYALLTQRSFTVSTGQSRDYAPRWDPKGYYLYFLSDRMFDPVLDSFDMEHIYPESTVVMGIPIVETTPPPVASIARAADFDLDDWANPATKRSAPTGAPDPNADPNAPPAPAAAENPPLRVDTDGMVARQTMLRLEPGRYTGLEAVHGGVLVVEEPIEGMLSEDDFGGGGIAPGSGTLRRFSVSDEEAKPVASDVSMYLLSGDATTVAYPGKGSFVVQKISPPGEAETIPLGGTRLRVSTSDEWGQVFNEAWRLQRDFFWAPNMVGVDWPAMREKYSALLPRVGSRAELQAVIGGMFGELGTSHAYLWGGERSDRESGDAVPVGLLGIDVEPAGSGARIARIFPALPQHPEARSPLASPHLGVSTGDIITAVDGAPLNGGNLYAFLLDRAGKAVTLTITNETGADRRRITVETLGSERELRYLDWVEANRRTVAAATGGKAGYIHIPDMGGDGLSMFSRQFFSQYDKPALLIDVRSNGGGFVSQQIVDRLARVVIAYDQPRRGPTGRYPHRAPHAHMVCLIDQHAGSDGDIFPTAFRRLGLGPLIGTRTWGGVVGIRGDKPFMDMGLSTQPEFAWWDADGWSIENEGVRPDIEVPLTPTDRAEDRDPQLDRAIAELTRRLEQDPMDLPPVPAYPVRRPR